MFITLLPTTSCVEDCTEKSKKRPFVSIYATCAVAPVGLFTVKLIGSCVFIPTVVGGWGAEMLRVSVGAGVGGGVAIGVGEEKIVGSGDGEAVGDGDGDGEIVGVGEGVGFGSAMLVSVLAKK